MEILNVKYPKYVIWQILSMRGLKEAIIWRKAWLMEHQPTQPTMSIEEVLVGKNAQEVSLRIHSIQQANRLLSLIDKTHRVFLNLPQMYRDILDELAINQMTWRYLRAQKYVTNRRIKSLKEEALTALYQLLLESEDNYEN